MLKSIAAISAAAITSVGIVPSAHAYNWDFCKSDGGMHMCAQYRRDNDVIQINSQMGYVRFGVKCVLHDDHFTWEWKVFETSPDNRYNKAFMNTFSEGFCEGRLGLLDDEPKYSMA